MINDISQGEIFVQSRCIMREQVIKNFLNNILDHLGFTAVDSLGRIMKKESKTVILCLVDDFNVCGATLHYLPEYWFDKDTVVLTDNRILFNPKYTVLELPVSFYSTFSYTPNLHRWDPERDFHFSINRGDEQRLLFFKEFQNVRGLTDLDFINYNAAYTTQEPFRNHQLFVEEAYVRSNLNLVIETYIGDKTITFSEKTFRALQTPAPWMLYACTGSINYLRNLGFDLIDDIVDHSYDSIQHTGNYGINKMRSWLDYGLRNLENIKKESVSYIQTRCNQAAIHNQNLLKNLKPLWPTDFSSWLDNMLKVLHNTN